MESGFQLLGRAECHVALAAAKMAAAGVCSSHLVPRSANNLLTRTGWSGALTECGMGGPGTAQPAGAA